MPVVKKTRRRNRLDELSPSEAMYFIMGHDFFNEIDTEKAAAKWPSYRNMIMNAWLKFKPFKLASYEFDCNPGTRPWSWWNFDNPEYMRNCVQGTPGWGEFDNGTPRYYSGPSTYESQAAFLQRKKLLTPQEKLVFSEMPETETIL